MSQTTGRKIRRLRKLRGMSSRALAKEAGIAHYKMLQIEAGLMRKPPAEKLSKIAEVLEAAFEELI